MKRLLFAFLTCVAMLAHSQQLKIPDSTLFSKDAGNLQPLIILMIPGTPIVGFCPGFSGGFDKIRIEDTTGNMLDKTGLLVTAILVDKEQKKIIDNLDCSWESSNSEVLTAVSAARNNKRLFALLPQKAGATKLTIKMGKEQVALNLIISTEENKFRFKVEKLVQKPDSSAKL